MSSTGGPTPPRGSGAPGAPRIFVTGTDTGVGKTVVCAALALGLDGYYWKPVQAGKEPTTDAAQVRRWTGLPADRFIPEAYVLEEPMSPHAAARLEGIEIDVSRILRTSLPTDRPLVMEGAGGILVPLTRTALVADLIAGLGGRVVLVVRAGLGTINHTLLSLEALARRSIPVLGVVMNGPAHESNRMAIEEYGRVPVIGSVPPCDVMDATHPELYTWRKWLGQVGFDLAAAVRKEWGDGDQTN